MNDCIPFKLPIEDIVSWGQDIERLMPDLELDKLQFLIDCFKTDRIEYDKTKGIQNIFNGLKLVERTETGFKVLRVI